MKSLFLALAVTVTTAASVSPDTSLPSKLDLGKLLDVQANSCRWECRSQRSRGECYRDCVDRYR